ncbi:hypothetical protein F4824DRAFT_156785 [Ustulina deusta]|nr:hypothetical protein F4824DRAFT_156785 [Ustulina deusta]
MRIRPNPALELVSLSITQLLISARNVAAQAIPDDSIVYTTLSGWGDMRACARCPFQVNFGLCSVGDALNDELGCMTNACLCRPSTLEEAVEFIDERVISLCSNYDDQATATSFLLRYCSAHGYTSVATATSPPVSSETPGSQSSSQETRETTGDSQSHTSITSNSSPSQTNPVSSPITSAPSTGSITNSSPTNAASPKTESGDDGLKVSDIIGIVVGILGLFIGALTLWVSWKTGRPKRLWQGVTSQRHVPQMRQV